MAWQDMKVAPMDGEIIVTNEGVAYWSDDFHEWRLCRPDWRDGKPSPTDYSCADNGAYSVDPVCWMWHPHDPTRD